MSEESEKEDLPEGWADNRVPVVGFLFGLSLQSRLGMIKRRLIGATVGVKATTLFCANNNN